MYGIVYLIICAISGKKYVGQTTRMLDKRWEEHKYNAFMKQDGSAIYSAMRKYGLENFKIKPVAYANNQNELDHRETYYIKLFNTLTPNGYNLLSGGSFGKHSEISKQKMSKAKKGRIVTESQRLAVSKAHKGKVTSQKTKIKMSLAQKGRNKGIKLSEETKKKISLAQKGEKNGFFGKKHTEESGLKISKKLKGRKLSPKHRSNLVIPDNKIKIVCNETGQIFSSYTEASNILSVSISSISLFFSNKQKSVKGFTFKKVSDGLP
jgi:group I intron endonuclease